METLQTETAILVASAYSDTLFITTMPRRTVTRFIARLSFFARDQTDIVTSTRDAVDVVRTVLVEWDFAHAIVAKPRLTIGVLITFRPDR